MLLILYEPSYFKRFLFQRVLLRMTGKLPVFLTWACVASWDSSVTVQDTPYSPHPAAKCPGYIDTYTQGCYICRAHTAIKTCTYVSYQRPSKLTHSSRALMSSSPAVSNKTQWDRLEKTNDTVRLTVRIMYASTEILHGKCLRQWSQTGKHPWHYLSCSVTNHVTGQTRGKKGGLHGVLEHCVDSQNC